MRACLCSLTLFAAAAMYCEGQARPEIRRLEGSSVTARRADAIADEELRKDHVMGAQLAILNHGRTVWTYAFGLRDAARRLPMTEETNIWAASITKGVFATWVMGLVEHQRFDLDVPLAEMLPQPLDQYEAYGESAEELVADPRWKQVTPRMMLAHTSGLSNLAALTEPDHKLRLHFAPGSRFAYAGDGLNLLQFVMERKLGEGIDAGMQRDLFGPLGMTRTGMVWRPEFTADSALRYDAAGKYTATTHRDNARAAGSMATTVRDLSRFTEGLLAGSVLTSSARDRMLSPQIAINFAHQFPTLSTETSQEGAKVGLAYGLGWGLLTHTRYGPAFFKEGHGDGAENYMICFTRSGDCMILLTNSDNGELAFRPLLKKLLGDDVTPWEWEGYTREAILQNGEHSAAK